MEAAWITLRDTVDNTAMKCLGSSTRRHGDWFDENHAEILDTIGKKRAAHLAHLYDPQCTTKKDALKNCAKCKIPSWWNPSLRRQEWHENLLQQSEGGLQSHQCRLISASECRWNQAHIREEQDPGEVGWVFRWCTKQAIIYQRQGHWTTAASPSEQTTGSHSNPGASSNSYLSTIHQQSTRIWFNSWGNLWGGWISVDG